MGTPPFCGITSIGESMVAPISILLLHCCTVGASAAAPVVHCASLVFPQKRQRGLLRPIQWGDVV
jgi:hypothetical protein